MLKLLKKHKWINVALLALLLCAMFFFSGQNRSESAAVSGWLVRLFGNLLSDHFIRKTAHFLEFSALGFLLTALFDSGKKMLWALPIGLLVAAADEFHQIFSEGRGPLVSDVALDFCGVLFGFAIVALCVFLLNRKSGSSR